MNTKLLRQKVLDLAIHGKLVPQNPEHESAAALLERIRGESLPLSTDGKPSSATPSAGSNAARNARSNTISEDKIPFEIPENWCWCKLKDIVDISSAKRVLKEDWKTEGIPFFRAREIAQLANGEKPIDDLFITKEMYESLKLNYGIPKAGDLMVSAVGTIGKIYIVREEDCFYYKDASVIRFSPLLKDINSSWLKKTIESPFLQAQIYSHSNGTTVDTITISTASEYFIPLPPLEEQKLIVEEIERIFALIDTVEQNKTDLETVIKQTKSKILDLAIHGKLVPQDKADEPASKMLKKLRVEKEEKIAKGELKRDKNDSYIYKADDGKWIERKADGTEEEIEVPFEIPERWCWCRLGELYTHTTGKALKKENTIGELKPYITTSNVYWDSFDLSEVKSMYFKDDELEKCTVKKGDLLICNGGDVGRAAIWNYDYDICYQNHVSRLRPKINSISNKFYYYIIKRNKEKGNLNGKGVGITSLSAADIQSLLVPLPPSEEQKRIVSKIEQFFRLIDCLK